MKKHGYKSLVVLGLLIGLAAISAHAQSKIKVNVPFDFSIGDTVLQAGEYTVQPASPNSPSEVLLVRDSRGHARAITMATRLESAKVMQPKLVFRRYGESYFLSQAWLSAGDAGSEIRKGSREKELAKNGAAPTLATIVVATH